MLQLGVRFYDPTLGRFTQIDPAWNSANPYLYVDDSPALMVEPTGLIACERRARTEALGVGQRYRKMWNDDDDGGPSNAMQHCVWACLTTLYCGELGGCIMGHVIDGHEFFVPSRRPIPIMNNPPASRMDLGNNAAGRDCAGSARAYRREKWGGVATERVYIDPVGDCTRCCEQKAYSGGLPWNNGKRLPPRPRPEPPTIRPAR